jgi:DNA (cytosine-5)-methyltransferase 1
MDVSKLRFIDLFAGVGGFHLGMSKIGAKCVFASEINKFARVTYKENFYKDCPELFDNGYFNDDIMALTSPGDQIPDFDILCGGFPCQPFSQAGKKKGFEDERGNMFFKICEIIKEKQPKAFILENVRNLKNHDEGRTFEVIKDKIENELGYSFYHKIVKASEHGLPQHRPRIFLVGFRNQRTSLSDFIFPESRPLDLTMSDIFGGDCPRNIGFTLRVGGRKSGINDRHNWDSYMVDGKVELLSVETGKAMMGLPESFAFPVSETQAMKQLGNSVAVPVVEDIAQAVFKYIAKNL